VFFIFFEGQWDYFLDGKMEDIKMISVLGFLGVV
jgi:hypothetical protein